jgi:hypothetical protein
MKPLLPSPFTKEPSMTDDDTPTITHDLTLNKDKRTLTINVPRSIQIRWNLTKGSRLSLTEQADQS